MKRKLSSGPIGAVRRNSRARFGMPLSSREIEIAALIAQGKSNKLIAEAANISQHTAKFHVNNIMMKYGAQTRTDAAVKFIASHAPHVCSSCGAAVSLPA